MRCAPRPFAAASIVAVLLLLTTIACGGSPPDAPPEAPAGGDGVREAATLPLPDAAAPPPPRPSGARSGGLSWTAPTEWIEQTPSSSMRIAQYKVPGPAGDGECVVFYFGPNQGGDAMANAERWAGQFTRPDGGSSIDTMKVSTLEDAGVPVQLVEVSGTYDGGMSMTATPAKPQPNSMLLGGIAEGPDAPWFFKLTGPEATVRTQREAFVGMMRSLRTGG